MIHTNNQNAMCNLFQGVIQKKTFFIIFLIILDSSMTSSDELDNDDVMNKISKS